MELAFDALFLVTGSGSVKQKSKGVLAQEQVQTLFWSCVGWGNGNLPFRYGGQVYPSPGQKSTLKTLDYWFLEWNIQSYSVGCSLLGLEVMQKLEHWLKTLKRLLWKLTGDFFRVSVSTFFNAINHAVSFAFWSLVIRWISWCAGFNHIVQGIIIPREQHPKIPNRS